MDIYVQATIGVCAEFKVGGKKEETSIVISPLKITTDESVLKINSGCNMWKACKNTGCQYSLIAREQPQMKKA